MFSPHRPRRGALFDHKTWASEVPRAPRKAHLSRPEREIMPATMLLTYILLTVSSIGFVSCALGCDPKERVKQVMQLFASLLIGALFLLMAAQPS